MNGFNFKNKNGQDLQDYLDILYTRFHRWNRVYAIRRLAENLAPMSRNCSCYSRFRPETIQHYSNPVDPVDPVRKFYKMNPVLTQTFPARNSCRKFMQKLSLPARVSAAVMLAIIFLSSGLTMAPSRPLVMAITINVWFKKGRTGSP